MSRVKFPEHLIDISFFGRKDRIEAIMNHIKSMNSFGYLACDYNKIKFILQSNEDVIYRICLLLVNSPYFDYFGKSIHILTSSKFPDPEQNEFACLYTMDERMYYRYVIFEDEYGLLPKYKRDEKIDKILGI